MKVTTTLIAYLLLCLSCSLAAQDLIKNTQLGLDNNRYNDTISNGIYLYQLATEQESITKKMVLKK